MYLQITLKLHDYFKMFSNVKKKFSKLCVLQRSRGLFLDKCKKFIFNTNLASLQVNNANRFLYSVQQNTLLEILKLC